MRCGSFYLHQIYCLKNKKNSEIVYIYIYIYIYAHTQSYMFHHTKWFQYRAMRNFIAIATWEMLEIQMIYFTVDDEVSR